MKQFVLGFLLLVLGSLCAYAQQGDSLGVTDKDGKPHVIYKVAPGETVWRISTRYGVSIDELMATNPELEEGLKADQVIMVPYKKDKVEKPAKKGKFKYHTVQPGETYWRLSKQYGVSIDELLKWNDMELKAGQKLIVGVADSSEVTTDPVVVKDPDSETDPDPEKDPDPDKDQEKGPVVVKVKEEVGPFEEIENKYSFDPNRKQVIVIPFNPYLYFSDADDMIARQSRISRTKVRYRFRNRLNALIDPEGYETIHLLGGSFRDTLTDLNKIYQSVSYGYDEAKESETFKKRKENGEYVAASNMSEKEKKTRRKVLDKLQKLGDKLNPKNIGDHKDHHNEKLVEKYWAVKVKDPLFYEYFQKKYDADYFIFINQFEVSTNFEVCAGVAPSHYDRTFVTHFTIMDKDGNKIAGNRFEFDYNSNTNDIDKTVDEAMPYVADRILAEMPAPNE